jgi:hypothetical protein
VDFKSVLYCKEFLRYIESNTGKSAESRQRTIEILPSSVGEFPVLHFMPVFDFISHFYQLFLVSCLLMYF